LIDWKGDGEFKELYAKLFELRKKQPAFSDGGIIRIPSTNDRRVYAFARVSGPNKFIVAFNFDTTSFSGSLSVLSPGLITGNQINLTDVFTNQTMTITIPSTKLLPIEIPAMGFRVFQIEQTPR
jgi:glycosidase